MSKAHSARRMRSSILFIIWACKMSSSGAWYSAARPFFWLQFLQAQTTFLLLWYRPVSNSGMTWSIVLSFVRRLIPQYVQVLDFVFSFCMSILWNILSVGVINFLLYVICLFPFVWFYLFYSTPQYICSCRQSLSISAANPKASIRPIEKPIAHMNTTFKNIIILSFPFVLTWARFQNKFGYKKPYKNAHYSDNEC